MIYKKKAISHGSTVTVTQKEKKKIVVQRINCYIRGLTQLKLVKRINCCLNYFTWGEGEGRFLLIVTFKKNQRTHSCIPPWCRLHKPFFNFVHFRVTVNIS